jgi:hypothetical protein
MAVAVTTVAMAASLLFLILLPVAPALVSSAPYAYEVRSVIRESAKDYMEQKARQGVTNLSSQRKDGQQMGHAAADGSGALVFDISVGTSPQTVSLIMDITGELVWAQCDHCTSCVRFTPPGTRTFLPKNSDSFREVGCASQTCQRAIPGDHHCAGDRALCTYIDTFIGGGNTSGFLATDTFSFGTTPVPGVVFGCSGDIMVDGLAGASGFAGFNTGGLSLVSQLNMSRFTYFIAPLNDAAGKSFVSWSSGDADNLDIIALQAMMRGRRSSTPLLAATEKQDPDLYYVKLTGVQLDGKLLTAIPAGTFDVRSDGSGGAILSTTLPVTYLEEAAYRVLRRELVSRVQSEGVNATGDVNQLCFLAHELAKAKVPVLSLVFDGADRAMEFRFENYFFDVSGGLTCFTILPSTGGTVLGSLLQAGRTMTYDIHGGQLTFQTAAASALAPERVALMVMVTLLAWVLAPQSLV